MLRQYGCRYSVAHTVKVGICTSSTMGYRDVLVNLTAQLQATLGRENWCGLPYGTVTVCRHPSGCRGLPGQLPGAAFAFDTAR